MTASASAAALTRDLAALSAVPVLHTHHVRASSLGSSTAFGTPPSPTALLTIAEKQQRQQNQLNGISTDSSSDTESDGSAATTAAAQAGSAATVSTTAGSHHQQQQQQQLYIAELKGYLSKWTNYIHGWQPRYIVLRNGTLSYYKSEVDSDFGCRGAISLQKATIKSHEFDDCRIDVSVNNCVWYLRADTPEDKSNWIEVLQSYNTSHIANNNNNNNNHIHGEGSLRRHGSTISLQSMTLSTTSGSSLKRANRSLREKVYEIETFKDILFGQIDTLQRYFDACAELNNSTTATPAMDGLNNATATGAGAPLDLGGDLRTIDFKGESITFRATTAGVLTTLQHCLDIINERDQSFKKRMDKEVERRRRSEGLSRKYKDELDKTQNSSFPGPDLEEGPHSTLPEDEFFDAVESGLDKIEEDRKLRVRLRLQSQQSQISSAIVDHDADAASAAAHQSANATSSNSTSVTSSSVDDSANGTSATAGDTLATAAAATAFGTGALARQHRLWPQISDVCTQQLHHARQGVGEGDSGWQLFADEGEMKMYRREEEIDGMVVDPLKACHVVQGVSAKEMCHFFFMPEYRNDWETTLEDMTILEQISPDAIVFLQTHKRIWPATQRDALFWSHMQNVKATVAADDADVHDAWAVCNHSIEHDSYPPANSGKCIRLFLTVILVCQTYVRPVPAGQAITRDDLTCKITYCSTVNPGGWAPKTALRAVYKREYPKFLKRFTHYVIDQCKDKPIMF